MTANYISISDITSILVCQRNNHKKIQKARICRKYGLFCAFAPQLFGKKRLNVLLYKKSYHKSREVCYNIKKFIRMNSFSADRSEHHGSVRRIT